MGKPKQRSLLRRPNRVKKPAELVLRRPTKNCAPCMNFRGKVNAEGCKVLVACGHKGRPYELNESFRMVVCVCCLRRMVKGGVSARECL